MTQRMLLGIDLGTTMLKVAAFDATTGALLAGESARLAIAVGPDGKREQDLAGVDRALHRLCTKIRKAVGSRWAETCGIGLAAQGGSTIIARRETGAALTPMVLWNDMRALPQFDQIAASKSPRYWRSFSLCDEPGMGLARIEWLRARRPALLNDENIYVGAGEYVYFHLTGQWRQDACHALQTGCYDAVRKKLTARALTLIGTPLSFFAPLRDGHEQHPLEARAAKRLGLPEGIPVVGPYMDHEAGYMSAMHVSPQPLQCSLGTAWVGNFVVPENSAGRSPFQLAIPSPASEGRLVVMPLLTGNVTWDWALETFVDANHGRALLKQEAIFAEALLPELGLTAIPWLNRPHLLRPEQAGAGVFSGMAPSTTRDDLVRAVAAGMVFELARIFEQVRSAKIIDSVALSGGASKGKQFRQLIATLFAPLPVRRIADEDWMGTRGCLYGLNRRVARAKVAPIAPLRRKAADAVQAGYTLYQETFDQLCADVLVGEAFHVAPVGSRRPSGKGRTK